MNRREFFRTSAAAVAAVACAPLMNLVPAAPAHVSIRMVQTWDLATDLDVASYREQVLRPRIAYLDDQIDADIARLDVLHGFPMLETASLEAFDAYGDGVPFKPSEWAA